MEIGRARLQPVRKIHVRSPRSQSPPCLSSSRTRTARSQARTHSSERARRECNALQRGKHNQPFFSRELRRHAAHNDIRSQYAYANNMLYESSSTPPCPPPRRKTGGASPSLRGEETAGRASDPRERALDLMGKEEDRDSPVFIPAT